MQLLFFWLLLADAEHPIDDVFYPKNLLKFWARAGMDITGLDAIPGLFHISEKLINLWPVENGHVTINIATHVDFGVLKRQFITYADLGTMLDDISREMTCIKFRYAPLNSTETTGLVFVPGPKCFTALGHAPGFVGKATERIADKFGVGEKWQIISINDSCSSAPAVLHLLMHALGVIDEHMRFDRFKYLKVDRRFALDQYKDQLFRRRVPQHALTDTPYRYDPRSIMQLSSFAYSNFSGPVMATKDNGLVAGGQWLSLTDVARMKWLYCRNERTDYIECDR